MNLKYPRRLLNTAHNTDIQQGLVLFAGQRDAERTETLARLDRGSMS